MAQLLKHTKYCTIYVMPNVPIHSLNLKSQIHRGKSLQFFFSLRIANLLNSLPENVVEALDTDLFKSRFDRHSREGNLLFDVDIDYTNVYALSALRKSKKKQYLIDLP